MLAVALTRERTGIYMDTKGKDQRKDLRGERERDQRKKLPDELIRRLNPRYVFNDPNVFFHDLLMGAAITGQKRLIFVLCGFP